MKKILIIKGRSAYNVLRLAADEICRGFEKKGYLTEVVDLQKSGAKEELQRCLNQCEQYEFCFSIQGLGWELEKTALFKLQEMQRVGWLVDDPCFHAGRLNGSVGKGTYVITVQDSFTERIRNYYQKFEDVSTLYHGGFVCAGRIPWEQKDIDVFFSGSYSTKEEKAEKIKAIEGTFGAVAQSIKENMDCHRHIYSWDEEVRRYLEKIQFDINQDEYELILQVLYPLDQYQRACMRNEMIETLLEHGIKVSVVGEGWETYQGKGKDNLNILSAQGVDIQEVVKLMQRSKIVLHNVNFKMGMHERIFSAMLANAIVVTNEYRLLKRFFTNGKNIVTYSLAEPERLPVVVNQLLNNPEYAQTIADAGYKEAIEKHTWEHRGEQIIQWIQDGQEFCY